MVELSNRRRVLARGSTMGLCFALTAMAATAIMACSTADGPSTGLKGTWKGSFDGNAARFQMTVATRNDSDVTGTGAVTGSAGEGTFNVSGTSNGTSVGLTLALDQPVHAWLYGGTFATSDSIAGTLTAWETGGVFDFPLSLKRQ
jgi:hypothetical protein